MQTQFQKWQAMWKGKSSFSVQDHQSPKNDFNRCSPVKALSYAGTLPDIKCQPLNVIKEQIKGKYYKI